MRDFQIVVLATTTGIIVAFVELLRRRQLREKYAALWVAVAVLIVPLALFPTVLDRAAQILQVADPVNFLLFMAVVFLLAVAVHHSWELSRLEEETRTLAEEVAMLRISKPNSGGQR